MEKHISKKKKKKHSRKLVLANESTKDDVEKVPETSEVPVSKSVSDEVRT